MSNNINIFYNFYENQYKKLCKKYTNEEAYSLLNDAVLYSYLSIRGVEINDDLILLKDIKFSLNKMNPFISFKESSNKSEFKDLTANITSNFVSNNMSFDDIENMLSHVSEKHINRKKTGSYYTPDDTTYYITKKTILLFLVRDEETLHSNVFEWVLNSSNKLILNKIKDNEIVLERVKQKIKNIKIIDPTCGSGIFILKTFEYLIKIYKHLGISYNYIDILNSLYGLDISTEAISLLKNLLFIKMMKYDFDDSSFDFNSYFNSHFRNEDALTGADYVIDEGHGFDWKDYLTKFDVIIGNPPYVERKNIKINNAFKSYKCGNLYANVIERALNIVNKNGVIGFIVPLPLMATKRMTIIRELLESNSNNIAYLSFADRPGCLFNGVHQRLVIFFSTIKNEENDLCNIYTSSYNYWNKSERDDLYKNIKLYRNNLMYIPKVGSKIEADIYKKITAGGTSLFKMISNKNTDFSCYMSTRIGLWSKCFIKNIETNEIKKVYFSSKHDQILFDSILNSSTFYFFWILVSDCWHVINFDLDRFKINEKNITDKQINELEKLVKSLETRLEDTKKFIGSKQVEYEYKHKYAKDIIDQIDDILSEILGLTSTQCEYIKNFKLKYRMNNALERK